MRHLTRLYFENTSATEQFVSLVDQGVERVEHCGNPPVFIPLYSIKVGSISNPMTLQEETDALQFLQFTPCFFKLPIGAHAIVDVYVPDVSESQAPKVFDYQVFKAKNPEHKKDLALNMAQFRERHSQTPAKAIQQSGSQANKAEGLSCSNGPNGPISDTGPTGPTSVCCYSSTGPSGPGNPCGGETCIPCDDPIFQRASCVQRDGMWSLICVQSEPPPDNEK